MTDRGVAGRFRSRLFATTLAVGAPGVVLSLVLLWGGVQPPPSVCCALTAVVLGAWWYLSFGSRAQRIQQLRTIANVLAAYRDGDYSVRARQEAGCESLGAALDEVNAIGETLRNQRLGAIEAHALLAKVIVEIDVAIFAFDKDERLRLVNPAGERLLGSRPGRLLGKTAASLRMSSLLRGERARTLDGRFPGATGPWEMWRTSFRQDGMPHALVVLTDLRRALRAEERQTWQRLVRVLGHEINNSLAPIRSITAEIQQILRRTPRSDGWESGVARGLEIVERRAEALGRFMTAYARLAKLPAPVPAPLDVEMWVRRVVDLDTRIAVTVERGPSLSVLGDSDQLDQLLINLLKNAIDAALETQGGVSVSWRRAGRYVELVVTDDGPGIAAASSLFVPFFTTKPGGSGIGLVLSRQIAEAHEGALHLVDRVRPHGCRAVLKLPLPSGIVRAGGASPRSSAGG
jgi:PAS domain S-box-containing protein